MVVSCQVGKLSEWEPAITVESLISLVHGGHLIGMGRKRDCPVAQKLVRRKPKPCPFRVWTLVDTPGTSFGRDNRFRFRRCRC